MVPSFWECEDHKIYQHWEIIFNLFYNSLISKTIQLTFGKIAVDNSSIEKNRLALYT